MQHVTPFIEAEIAEHGALAEVVADRVEILERIASLSRQLDALDHRALELTGTAAPAPAAAPPPAKAPAKPKAKAKAAKPKARAAKAPAAPRVDVKAELLTYLQGREDPVGTVAISEALGFHRTAIDNAIKACNGQITKVVQGAGPKPSLYMLTANLPADGWPHTGGNAGGTRSAPGGAADQAERAQADAEAERRRAEEEAAHAEREAERAAAAAAPSPVPPVSPRVARELAREAQPAGEHDDVQPENLAGRVLRALQDNGGMRVREIAETLNEDPPVVARVVSDHIKACNVRKNPDGTYYAVGQMATA